METYPDTYENSEWYLDPSDLEAIRDYIILMDDEQTWEESGESIWNYDEIKENLTKQVIVIDRMIKLIEEYPEIEISFYDSY